jgi:hypothetical protein
MQEVFQTNLSLGLQGGEDNSQDILLHLETEAPKHSVNPFSNLKEREDVDST